MSELLFYFFLLATTSTSLYFPISLWITRMYSHFLNHTHTLLQHTLYLLQPGILVILSCFLFLLSISLSFSLPQLRSLSFSFLSPFILSPPLPYHISFYFFLWDQYTMFITRSLLRGLAGHRRTKSIVYIETLQVTSSGKKSWNACDSVFFCPSLFPLIWRYGCAACVYSWTVIIYLFIYYIYC